MTTVAGRATGIPIKVERLAHSAAIVLFAARDRIATADVVTTSRSRMGRLRRVSTPVQWTTIRSSGPDALSRSQLLQCPHSPVRATRTASPAPPQVKDVVPPPRSMGTADGTGNTFERDSSSLRPVQRPLLHLPSAATRLIGVTIQHSKVPRDSPSLIQSIRGWRFLRCIH